MRVGLAIAIISCVHTQIWAVHGGLHRFLEEWLARAELNRETDILPARLFQPEMSCPANAAD